MGFKLLMDMLTLFCCKHPSPKSDICKTSRDYLSEVISSGKFDDLDIQYMLISERQHKKLSKYVMKEKYLPVIRDLNIGMRNDFVKLKSYEECKGRGRWHEDEYCEIERIIGDVLENKQSLIALICLNHVFSLESLRKLTTGYDVNVEEERIECQCTEVVDAKVYKVTIKHQ
jgi:hypothetical protein